MSDSNFMKANGGKPTATSSANSSAPNSQARLMESSGNSHLNDTAAPKSTPSGGGSSSAVDVLIPERGGPTNINKDAPTSSSSASNPPTSRGGTGGANSSSREASHQAQTQPQQQSSSQFSQQQQQPHHSRTTTGHSVSGGAAAAAVQHSSSPSNVTATSSGQYNNHNNNSNAAAAAVTLAATEEAFLTSPLTIGFDGVTVMLDSSRGHVAIEKASGLIRGGRLTGIVSCCGARGDYTLLNALAGYEECATGTILANGTPVFAPAFRKSSVLLDEDFTAMDDLTVRQNLQYAASMRVASLDSDSVDATIGLLNLESVEHRAVSRCNAYTRRRVALGKELLLRPRAIFIDQPVQGLATHEARQYLQLLRRVAQKRVVVVTLVQPRWVLLELMDDVILLEGKLVAYNGTSAALLQILHVDAEQIPDSALTSIYRLASSPECSLYESFQRLLAHHQRSSGGDHHHHHHGNVANPTSSDPNALVISNHAAATSPQVELFFQLCAEGRIYFDPVVRSSPNPHWQFLVLVQYSLYRVRNNVVLLSTLFAVVLIVAIILAAIYSSQTGQSGMQNRIGMIFFLVSSTFLQNMLFVETRRREFLSFLRHRAHGYYGAALYLIFTVVSTAFVRFLTSAVFTVIVYSLGNIGSGEWAYSNLRDLVAIVALTSYSTNLVVYFVTSIARTARIAHFILFALYTFDVILAGIILNVNTLPKPFQVVSLMSHVRLGYEVAVITQFVGQDFGCVKGGGNDNTTESCYTGDEYLNFLGFSEDRRWPNVELLFLLSGITVVVWYFVMVFYKPPRAAMLAAQFTKSHR